jgi:hypothetical protein
MTSGSPNAWHTAAFTHRNSTRRARRGAVVEPTFAEMALGPLADRQASAVAA